MDEPSLPTAAELGITEAEYERILRDLRARRAGADAVPPLTGGGPVVRERRPGAAAAVVLAGVVAFLAVLHLVGAGAATSEPEYAFMQVRGDQPATYTSCGTIRVAIYPAGGPPDAEQLVRDAVARIRSATGLDVAVSGVFGGHAPNWNFEAAPVRADDPISVSWQDGAAIAELTEHVAGLGGSRTLTNPDGSLRLVAGTIALSRDYYAYLTERGDRDEALAVLLHEFGHVFGLDHVDSREELMAAKDSNRNGFGVGDLQGLRRLGQGPCV